MATTSGMFDWAQAIAQQAADDRAGISGGGGLASNDVTSVGTGTTSAFYKGPEEEIIPDWMTTNPDDLTGELQNEYGQIGRFFNPKPIRKAYNQSIDTAMGMGGQIADNAMMEAIARGGMEGSAVNSGMVKAQAMLPVFQHTSDLRKERAQAIVDLRVKQQAAQMQVAQLLSAMRVQHLATLGDMYITGRGQNVSAGLEQQRIDIARNAASASRSSSGGGGGGAASTGFQGQITRSPNNAGGGIGVEYTPEYEEYLASLGKTDEIRAGATPYPAGGGAGFGTALDEYNKSQRDMIATAMPGVPSYNVGGLAQYYGAMGSLTGHNLNLRGMAT